MTVFPGSLISTIFSAPGNNYFFNRLGPNRFLIVFKQYRPLGIHCMEGYCVTDGCLFGKNMRNNDEQYVFFFSQIFDVFEVVELVGRF